MPRQLTNEEFKIKLATKNYDLISIVGSYTKIRKKIDMWCHRINDLGIEHGPYKTIAGDLLYQGRGCQKCRRAAQANGKTKYTFNKAFFEMPNLTNSYWAGLLAADGNVDDTSHVAIQLKGADSNHLQWFMNDIEHTGRLYHGLNQLNGKSYPRSGVFISNAQKLIHDLRENFNITPRKSMTLCPPTLSDDLKDAFIVGYLDGDGHIRMNPIRPRIHSCGTFEILVWIQRRFDQLAPAMSANGLSAKPRRQGNIWVYEIRGHRAEKIFYHLSQIDCPHLKRKWAGNP